MSFVRLLFVLVVMQAALLFSPKNAAAQCSVCGAQAETNVHEGNDQAKGLNAGILYLMSAPYLVIAGVGYVWYKNYKKKDVLVDVKEDNINLN